MENVLSLSDITTGLGYTPVNKAGDTMSGGLAINAGAAVDLNLVNGSNYMNHGGVGSGTQYIDAYESNFQIYNSNSSGSLQLAGGNAPNSGITISSANNVGIGTTNPANPLHIVNTVNGTGLQLDGALNPGLTFAVSGAQKGNLGVATSTGSWSTDSLTNDLVLRSQGTSQRLLFNVNGGVGASMMALNNGNVGIGTTTPTQPLAVNGNAYISTMEGAFATGGTTGQYCPVLIQPHNLSTLTPSGQENNARMEFEIYRDDIYELPGPNGGEGSSFNWGSFRLMISAQGGAWGHRNNFIHHYDYRPYTQNGTYTYSDPVANIAAWYFSDTVVVWLKGGGYYHIKNLQPNTGTLLLTGNPTCVSQTINLDTANVLTSQSAGLIRNVTYFPTAGWVAPTFQNSWGNYGGVFNTAGYLIDSNGFVHLRGLVSGGAGGPACIFTLPAGFTPPAQVLAYTYSNNGATRIDITSAGCVECNANCSSSWTSLEGINFSVY